MSKPMTDQERACGFCSGDPFHVLILDVIHLLRGFKVYDYIEECPVCEGTGFKGEADK